MSPRIDKITRSGPTTLNLPNVFFLSFPQLLPIPPPSAMASSPLVFSSDLDGSLSSDSLSFSSRMSGPRNPEFSSGLDIGLTAQSDARSFGGFLSSDPRSHQASMYASSSSVCSLILPHRPSTLIKSVLCCTIPRRSTQRPPTSLGALLRVFLSRSFLRFAPNEIGGTLDMRSSSEPLILSPRRIYAIICIYSLIICAYILDISYAKYSEHISRSTHEAIIKNLGHGVVAVSTGFKNLSDRVEASINTPKIEEMDAYAPPTAPSLPTSKLSNVPTFVVDGTIYFTREPPRPPKQEEFPGVRNWLPSDYKSKRKAGKKGEAIEAEENGEKPKGPILSSYMVDERGEVVPRPMQFAARDTAKGFFNLLLEIKRAPPCWGNAAIDIKNELRYRLETGHEFLRYCNNHWKADMIATNSYSQWLGKKLGHAPGKNTPVEVIDVDAGSNGEAQKRPLDEGEDAPGPSKRPRAKETLPPTSARRRPKPTPVNKKPQVYVHLFILVVCVTNTVLSGHVVRIQDRMHERSRILTTLCPAQTFRSRQLSR